MALPSQNMYDTFKDKIWKALGPLDPDWFEVLTAQTSANEASGSDQDELCANQEGLFKTPLYKTAVGSQPFSTPKDFRHSRIVSPETEDEQSFSAAQEKDALPWMETQSPYLFRMSKQGAPGTKCGGIQPQNQHSFDLLHTPHKSPISYAYESLGVQMNPDISWTSSLNTPPAVPSTLILSKTDESPCPASVPADKNIVFVRKLFPSLSNASRVGVTPPINDDIPTDNYGSVLAEPVSPQTSLTQNGVQQKMLLDARADGEACNTVAGVADGPGNVSSTFLANSSSSLRKVKPDRVRQKRIKSNEHDCSATDIRTTNSSNEEGKADEELGTVPPSPPVKTGSTGISQWSPLSLSEIPPYTADSSILTELQTSSDSRQLIRSPLKIADSGFIRKKRKFIYTVETLKPQVQENETDFQKMDTSPGIPDSGPESSSKQSADTTDEADCCGPVKNGKEKQENLALENLSPSVQEKVQDLDMSQLHRDFAQDFTEISDSGKLSKVVEEDQNYFSPSACLLAMKQVKQKRQQANLHRDCNSISNTGHMSTTSQNYSISEGTISDSGFQSAVADSTHTASSFIVPCLENTGSKTDTHRTTPFPSTHKGNGKSQLKERQTLNSERESQLDVESTLTQLPRSPTGTVDGLNCIPLNGEVHGSLPEKPSVPVPSVHASGFRTASNKGIQISLANLEKARHLLEESESERTLRDQPNKCNRAAEQKNTPNNGSMKSTVSVSNQLPSVSERFEGVSCHLTASQKADVKELCILLEEADSQFEFTQFKTAEVKQPCQENACTVEGADKDLDPDFLAGIDFDDSFSSDAEKQLAVTAKPDKMTCVLDEKSKGGTSDITSKSTDVLMSGTVKQENISVRDVLPSSENIPERSTCVMSTSKMEKQNPLMLDVAFKTAGGNALRVSKTCLSKARALFADLEINVSDLSSSDKQGAETDAKGEKMCGEQSKSATDDLKFTLKDDCRVEEKIPSCFSNTKQTVSAFKQVTSVQDRYATEGFENGKMNVINISEECAILHTEFESVNTALGGPHPDAVEMNSSGVLDFKNPASFIETPVSTSKLLPCSASKIIDSVTINELSSGVGFCTASGKKVSVSADAMKKAKHLLCDTYTLEDTGTKPNALRTEQLTAQNKESPPKTSGLQRAMGKGVSISSTAHKKEYLLSESDKVDDKIDVKPPRYKIPVNAPVPSNGGFLSASGKKIMLSSDALQKAKARFSDISFSAEIPVIPHTRNSDNCENADQMQNGFTAEGGKVHILEKSILKGFEDSVLSKAMQETEDCDMNVNNGMSVKLESLEPVRGSGSELEIRPDRRATLNISVASANKQVKQKDTLPLQRGGFSTASGKRVSISSDALKRAKSLLGECDKVDDKINVNMSHLKTPVCGPLSKSGGFHAASGKPVALSHVSLQKGKALFSDIIPDAESPDVPYTKNSDKNHESGENTGKMQCGFKTAGGKKVHVSQKNLLKAKHFLKDCDDSTLTKAVQEAEDCDMDVNGMSVKNKSVAPMSRRCSDRKNLPETRPEQKATLSISVEKCLKGTDKQVEHKQDHFPPQSGKFQTASGKGVAISSEALRKAKSLFAECDEVDDKIGVKPSCLKIPVHGSLPKNGGFRAASGKPVALSSEALQRGKALFSDITFSADIPHRKNSDKKYDSGENTRKMQSGFKTAVGEQVQVPQKNSVKAKHLLKEFDDLVSTKAIQEADCFTKDCDMDVNCGISKDSRNECTEVTNEHGRQKNTLPQQRGGFQTASGKEVIVSSEALKSAKTLLSECEGVDKASLMPAASRKPVALSSAAMPKAEDLLSDSLSTYTPAAVHTRKNDKNIDAHNKEKIHYGFTTAGGVKVHVSENSLLKATSLFKEFGDAECHDSLLFSTSPQDNHTLNQSKVKDVEGTSGCNLAGVCDKDIPAKGSASLAVKSVPPLRLSSPDHESETFENSSGHSCSSVNNKAPKDAFKFQEDTVTPSGAGTLHDCPEEEMPCMLDYEMNKVSSTKESKVLKADECSVLNFQSLDLTGCSETQQKFLAQEALDCTKALLEDEGLAGQSLLMILEDVPLQHYTNSNISEGGEKRRGKRSPEDPEMTGQPPLKRRLLEEFDRTLVDPKAPALHPVKSCPNGLMKDRGVFQYSTSLYPNITWPHGNGKNFVETRFQKTPQTKNSNPGDGRSERRTTSAFVPPFVRNAKAETHKNAVLRDNMRTPSAFVPPFKKQRTTVHESSSKPQEGEDKHQRPFVMLCNSSTFVPPTKKTQGPADVTDLAATPTDDMNNQSLPAECGSVGAVEETSGVAGMCSRNQDVYQNPENIELARDMQDMRIRKKKRQNIRPLPGSLFLTKTSGVTRIPLKAAANGKTPGRYTPKQLYACGVQKHVSDITSDNAESFRFNLLQFMRREAFTDGGGVQLADGGWLVPSNDGTAGKEEFYRALCDTPGVDPKLISDAWVYNHYRWIVWKQASMEKSFPEIVSSRCLTPEQVLLQLKYRYDVEVDHSRRPALRKIMEKDDTAVKTLVLCVCGIISRGQSPKRQSHGDTKTPRSADVKVETPAALIWLTDGWYAIKAQLDEPLTAMVHKGRLAVGGKLIINGAQLVGSQDACSPLEAPESLMLKICANSCRPARWDAKLGFHKDPRPFLLPVSCLYSTGGPVGCVDIVVLRSYPIQWMERKPDGGVVFRSSRAEEKEARRYSSQKQKAMEILFAKIQAEFENEERGDIKPQRRRKTISHQEMARLQDGEELHEAVGDDPAYLEAHLSAQQLEALHTYRRSVMEKKQAELQDRYRRALEAEDSEMSCPKREVTPVWRLCIADSTEQPGRVYQLNLWRPSSDLQSLLKEGCRYKVYNLTASDGKKHSCIEAVQLTGTKKTQFQELQASQEWLSSYFHPRVSTDFVSLQNPDFQSLCGEVDLTGYVISVIDGQGSSPAFYLADEKLNFVKVRCFSSLSQSGLENTVKPHVILALSNLQLRGQSLQPTPVVFAGDLTSFSTNPKEGHLQESLSRLKTLVQCQKDLFVTAEEKLSHLVKSNGLSYSSSPALQRETPASTTGRRPDTKTIAISQKPARSLGSFTPVSRNPPAPTSSAEKDPKSLKRRRALDYLSRIPSPPVLSHLGSVSSPSVNKTFNPPRRSTTPSTLKAVQTPSHKPTDSLREDEWVNDEELAMIDTQALRVNLM